MLGVSASCSGLTLGLLAGDVSQRWFEESGELDRKLKRAQGRDIREARGASHAGEEGRN